MKKYAYLLSIVGFIFNTYTFTSCVSAKKYQELEANHQKTIIEEKAAKNQLDREKAALEQKEREIIALKAENNKLTEEVINRASAGSNDIQKLQKKSKNLSDSLELQKNNIQELKNIWENKHDSLEYVNNQLKDDIKNLKNTHANKVAELQALIEKGLQKQNEQTIALKVADDEKKAVESEVLKLKEEIQKHEINLKPEENVNKTNNELGKDLAYYFLGYEAKNARVFNENGNYVVEIDEPFLFGINGKIGEKGAIILDNIKNIIKKYEQDKTNLLVETTGTGAEDRPQKAELVRKYLADGGLNTSSSPKNFAPIAFDTSKENTKKTKIYIKII
ncbi:MAG: hypothetical protein EAZ85_00785 [Bacteroidetes bacterium]|nr:MAG: hypothetical protein EAZ85_00785 [Bacteroidota bacterium]TAG89781.1 MAG: hypothetical protein EAZ20_05765 [Bacteroidota bacterium]